MKIIFSPTKSQSKIPFPEGRKMGKPEFQKQSDEILALLRNKTETELKDILKASDAIIDQSYKNIHNTKPDLHPALFSFSGTSFKELKPQELSETQLNYLQDKLRILSARYGVLTPLDGIAPYRLDMNNVIFTSDDTCKNLYDFWEDSVTNYFKEEDRIVNLASDEYAKMLRKVDQSKIINIHFMVDTGEKLKSVSIHAKQQRGRMLRFMVDNMVDDVRGLEEYHSEGYYFNPQLSDKNNMYFTKQGT
jgi:cytoplasmic iron level regulating protein YaaA (DUF328/UPF0246 family)